MATARIHLEEAAYLIRRDKNWARFQRFAVDMMSSLERVHYAASAFTFDNGRDGRTALVSTGDIDGIVCASTKTKPGQAVAKARSDLKRIATTGVPRRIALCFTCELEEHHKDQINAIAKEVVPSARVRVEGVEGLSQGVIHHPERMEEHYRGELLTLRHSLLSEGAIVSPTSSGLRIALATQFGADATKLRLDAMRSLIILTLGTNQFTRPKLQEKISAELGLVNRIHTAYLEAAVAELKKAGHIECAGEFIALSKAGVGVLRALIRDARARLLDGRSVFQDELRRTLPEEISDDDFDDLWEKLQDALADMFMQEGMSMVRAILDPVKRDDTAARHSRILYKLAVAMVATGYSPRKASELIDSIVNVLGGDTKTRGWLSQIAATFVSICALGLHPEAQEELLGRLKGWSLLVDNHVVISFFCASEDDHDGVIRVLQAWHGLGREISTCRAVLEEAGYHAFISEREYDAIWRDLPRLGPENGRAVIRNAFLRSFHVESAEGGYGRSRWNAFIANYKGLNRFDGTKIERLLEHKGWKVIDDTGLDKKLVDELHLIISPYGGRSVRLKPDGQVETLRRNEWDARIALSASARLAELQQASGGRVIVVTNSGAIRAASNHLASKTTSPVPTMSINALGYATSLSPGLSISLTDIRGLLFDHARLSQAVGLLEECARRISDRDRENGYDLCQPPQLQQNYSGAMTKELARIGRTFASDRERTAYRTKGT